MSNHSITFTPGDDGVSRLAGKNLEVATWGMSAGHGPTAKYGYRVSWGKKSVGISYSSNLVDAPPFRLERIEAPGGGDALRVTVDAPEVKTRIRLKPTRSASVPAALVEGECLLLRDPDEPIWEPFTAIREQDGSLCWRCDVGELRDELFFTKDNLVEWVIVAAPK